jgi:hypothetical protein
VLQGPVLHGAGLLTSNLLGSDLFIKHEADKTKFFNFLNWRVAQKQKHITLAGHGAKHVSIFGLYPETTSRK